MNPNLFVAGVPKAGTTSLFHYLALHPDVFPSSRKEPGFFHPFKIKDMDANLEAYKKFFTGHSGQRYAIEATPGYFYGGKETANAINKYSPKSKVIIVLRNPVERVFSFYKYKKSLGHIDGNLNFESYIDPNDPTNNCLDVAIITAPEKRTKKTIDKLKTVAGRVLNK